MPRRCERGTTRKQPFSTVAFVSPSQIVGTWASARCSVLPSWCQPAHPGRALGVLIEDPGVFEDDDRAEQIFQAVQEARTRGQIPGPTEERVRCIGARDT